MEEDRMEFLSVLAAAFGSWVFGAIWYMSLAKPWMEAASIEVDENGKPKNGSDPVPFILSALCMVVVAGMMRHIFAGSGVDTISKGLLSGLGIGAFFISPWIMINNAYAKRPFKLTLIDGGYAVFGCGIIGAILSMF
jgi:hypothetical protein